MRSSVASPPRLAASFTLARSNAIRPGLKARRNGAGRLCQPSSPSRPAIADNDIAGSGNEGDVPLPPLHASMHAAIHRQNCRPPGRSPSTTIRDRALYLVPRGGGGAMLPILIPSARLCACARKDAEARAAGPDLSARAGMDGMDHGDARAYAAMQSRAVTRRLGVVAAWNRWLQRGAGGRARLMNE